MIANLKKEKLKTNYVMRKVFKDIGFCSILF